MLHLAQPDLRVHAVEQIEKCHRRHVATTPAGAVSNLKAAAIKALV